MALVSSFAKEPLVSSFTKQPLKSSFIEEPDIDIVSREVLPGGAVITGGRPIDQEGSIAREAITGVPRGFRFIADVLGAAFGEDKEPGKEGPSLRGFLKESESLIEPRPKTFTQAAVGGIVENIARQASVIGLTGGKKALVLPILASGSGILKYRELRDAGIAQTTAAIAGTVNAVIEAATELLPLEALFKNDITGVKRWVTHTLADIVGENIADFSEQVSDAIVFNKPLPEADEMINRAVLTTVTTFGSGSVMSMAAVQANKMKKAKQEKIQSEVEAELALAIDKNVPKPVPTHKEQVSIEGAAESPEVGIDTKSLDPPSDTPTETNQKEKMDISEPAKNERAIRDVLDKPEEKKRGTKGFKDMVKAGIVKIQEDIDINKIISKISFPHTLAKKFKKFGDIYKRANDYLQERDTRISIFAKMIDPYFGLNKKSQTKIDTIKRMERIDRINTAFDQETLDRILSPEEKAGYAAFTDTMKASANQMAEHLIEMGASEQDVDTFLEELSPETYFPLARRGKFYTLTTGRDGKATHYEFHESMRKAKKKSVELHANDPTVKIKIGKVKSTSDEIARDIPINLLSILAKLDNNPDSENSLDKGLGVEFATIYSELTGKGFPTHLVKAKNTPGFETDLKVPVARYLDSLSTWMARREGRRDMNNMLSKIDPVKQSNLHRQASKYIDYVTGNTNELAGFRKFLFLYYIGGNVKSAIVNSTQTIMTGWPVMSKYTNWSGPKLAKYAAQALVPLKSIQKSDPRLADALQHGIFDGVLDAQHVDMLRGQGSKSVLGKDAEGLLTAMFSGVERYNRKTMFIAAYKEATGKGVFLKSERTVKTKSGTENISFKKRTKMNHEDAITFAEQLVDEAHWNMTKADRPAVTTGITAPVFTFKLFMGNYFSLMKSLTTEKEFGALARMLGATLVMGGLSAFPFAKDLEKILEKMGYDPRTSIKEMAGKWGDMLLHGALFPAGPDISGSISALEFVPSDIDQGTWPAVANVMLGVPADIVNRAQRAVHLYKLGDTYRAVETLMPEAVRNPMVAIRWAQEGMRTPRGKKIGDVATRDIILKFLAINPKAATKAYEREHSLRLLSERARAASENINQKVARAMFEGDWQELADINIEIAEHNQRMLANGTLEESIIPNPAAQKRAISLMSNPDIETLKRMPIKARQRAMELMEIHDKPQIGE